MNDTIIAPMQAIHDAIAHAEAAKKRAMKTRAKIAAFKLRQPIRIF